MSDGRSKRRCGCQEILEELSAYLDGDLSAARCRALERHLSECPGCDAVSARLRYTIEICRRAGRPVLPSDVRKQARARARALVRTMTGTPRKRR
jgi:anti-sigma factor RsiW